MAFIKNVLIAGRSRSTSVRTAARLRWVEAFWPLSETRSRWNLPPEGPAWHAAHRFIKIGCTFVENATRDSNDTSTVGPDSTGRAAAAGAGGARLARGCLSGQPRT